MARHYYLTRSGRLRRKDNTLAFEPAADETETEAAIITEDEAENSAENVPDTGGRLGSGFSRRFRLRRAGRVR